MDAAIQATIQQLINGGSGEFVGGLALWMVQASAAHIKRRFQKPVEQKALELALEFALETAFNHLSSNISKLTQYYLDCIADYLKENVVHQELAALLSHRPLNLIALKEQFVIITQGYEPEQIPDLNLEAFVGVFEVAFYLAVRKDKDLQPIIVIDRLDELVLTNWQGVDLNKQAIQLLQDIKTLLEIERTSPLFDRESVAYINQGLNIIGKHLGEWKIIHTYAQRLFFSVVKMENTVRRIKLSAKKQIGELGSEVENEWFENCEPKAERLRFEMEQLTMIPLDKMSFLRSLLEGKNSVVMLVSTFTPEDGNSFNQLEQKVFALKNVLQEVLELADYNITHIADILERGPETGSA